MASSLALSSARALGAWIRDELAEAEPAVCLMVRVLTREIDRWFADEAARAEVDSLVQEPPSTGDERWDALIEGVVAYRMDIAGMRPPSWTRVTRLEEGWDPYSETAMRRSAQWGLLDTLETPVQLLDKGVTLSYRDMELL